MADRLDPILTLLAGAEALRGAGAAYLPQHPQESAATYQHRLLCAPFFNYFKRATRALAARPFRVRVKLLDASDELLAIEDDIDAAGSDLTTFAHDAFRAAVAKGFVGMLADFPSDQGASTLAEERAAGRRPYLSVVHPEAFVAARSAVDAGQERFVHIRVREQAVALDPTGYEETPVERIRVLEPQSWQLWGRRPKGAPEWALVDGGPTSQPDVPLTVYYAEEREGTCLVEPPLADLASLNLHHWRSWADQSHVLTVARFPILAGSGVDVETLVVGPNKSLTTPVPEAKFYYVENSGAAINSGRQDLLDIQAMIAALSVDLLIRRTRDRTT